MWSIDSACFWGIITLLQAVRNLSIYSLWLGTMLVLAGVAMNAVAAVRYFRFVIRYRRDGSTDPGYGLIWGVVFSLLVTLLVSAVVVFLITTIR